MFINWIDDYSVGVKEFDDDHKKLIDLINKLHEAMSQGKGKDILQSIFQELLDYTVKHFGKEEKLMAQYQYPGINGHISGHRDLTKQAMELQDKFKNGTVLISIEVLRFLKDWLNGHILNTDMQYKSFFSGKKIS